MADADVSRQECGVIGTTKTDKNGSRIGCDIEVFSEQTRTSRVLRMASEVSWIGRSLSLSHDSENRNAADADVSRNKAVPMLGLNGCGSAGFKACSI